MWRWIENQFTLMRRLTAFEILAGTASVIGLCLAILSELRTQFYPEAVRVGRDIAIAIFLNFAIVILYSRLNRLRVRSDNFTKYSNHIAQGSHDISHALRDTFCKLDFIAEEYQNKMDSFAESVQVNITKSYTDNVDDRTTVLLDLLEDILTREEVIDKYPDLEQFVDSTIDKKNHITDKLRSDILSTTKDHFSKSLLIAKKQFKHSLEIIGIEDEEVSLTIKQLMQPPKRGTLLTGKLDDLEVFTCFRDPITHVNNNDRVVGQKFHVGKNSAFRQCFLGTDRSHWVFLKNNLKKAYEEGDYDNERADFYKYYNSALVIPIQDDKGSKATIYGFLAVDCPNREGRDVFKHDPHFYLLANLADTIALYWKVIDSYFPDIFSSYYELKFSDNH